MTLRGPARPPTLSVTLTTHGPALAEAEGIAQLLEQARSAEAAGVDRLLLTDHVVMGERVDRYPYGAFPFAPETPWLEPLTTIAALAAVTRRVRFSTKILIAPLRPAPLLAKTLATLDVLSGGRMEIGVSTGWQREEHAVGVDERFEPIDVDGSTRPQQVVLLERIDGGFEELRAFPRSERTHVSMAVQGDGDQRLALGVGLPPGAIELRVSGPRLGDRPAAPRQSRGHEDLRNARHTIHVVHRLEAQQIEDRRPDVDVLAHRFDDDRPIETERKRQHPGRSNHLAMEILRMSLVTVLLKRLAVVRSDHDDGLVSQSVLVQRCENLIDLTVGPVDRVVVQIGIARPEDRRLLVGEILMRIHVVDVEKETIHTIRAKEFGGAFRRVHVGSFDLRIGILRVATNAMDQRSELGLVVDLESLLKSERRRDPSVAPDSRRHESGIGEDLGGEHRGFGKRVIVACDPVPARIGRGPDRCHRRLRPRRLREMIREPHTRTRESIERRARRPVVPVGTEPVGSQRIDEDEDDVEIVPIREPSDVLRASDRPRVRRDPELGEQEPEQQRGRERQIEKDPSSHLVISPRARFERPDPSGNSRSAERSS